MWKELSGTVETSTCRGLTRRVIDGIRCSPKAGETRIEESEEVILLMMGGQQNLAGGKGLCFCHGIDVRGTA